MSPRLPERDRLRRLMECVTGLMSRHLPTEQLADSVARHTMAITGADGAAVALVDDAGTKYVVTAGIMAAVQGLRLEEGCGLSGAAVIHRALQYVADTAVDPRVDRKACERIGARSMLVVPVCTAGPVSGVVEATSRTPGAFDETDEYTLRLFAGLIAGALNNQVVLDENGRLLEERLAALQQASVVLDASPTAIIVHDLDGTVRLWNPAAEALFGWSAADAIGRRAPHVDEPDRKQFDAITERIVRAGTAATEIVRRRRRDGSCIDVRVSGAPLRDGHGRVTGIVRTLEDVTLQRERTEALRAAADRVRNIIEHSHHAFISMDASGRVIEWNHAAEQTFGWTRAEALMQRLGDLVVPPPARDAHQQGLQRVLETGHGTIIGRRVEVIALRKDGSTVPIELSINAAQVDGHPVFDAFLEDISERRAEMDLLRGQVQLDMLTGLPKREVFYDRLKAALDRHRDEPGVIAVIVVNLDGFRAVNDLYGHATGDLLLQEVARRLLAIVREHDTVARLGGDEFALLFEGLHDAGLHAGLIADEVLTAFEEPVGLRNSVLPLHASLGIATHEYTRDDEESIMHRAHEAMCDAKRAGGRRAVLLEQSAGP